MGYTHYWRINPIKGKAEKQEKAYQNAIKKCQKIVSEYNKAVKSIDPKDERRLSGYSAHTKVGQYGGLNFNGVGNLSHEDFSFREHFRENSDFDFCKTARKPYDVVVTACLIVMKHYLKDGINVSSDGDASEWNDGLELAKKVTKLKTLKNPIQDDTDCEVA